MTRALGDWFFRSALRSPDRTALVVGDRRTSYSELSGAARAVAGSLDSSLAPADPLVALFGQRTTPSYAGLLGILASGRGYVPLNPRFPAARNATILARSGARAVVVDAELVDALAPILRAVEGRLTVVRVGVGAAPEALDVGDHEEVWVDREAPPPDAATRPVSADAVAYLLFTSGTSGMPKGVPITHGSASAYVERLLARYDFSPEDRFSQCFDLTFDLSVHDLFVCWGSGASLYCLPEMSTMAPGRFIRDHELTVWFSVPSTIALCQRLGQLKPESLPSLRLSLFCGEALPTVSAEAWATAAPSSTIANLYGPTEATIAFTGYELDSAKPARAENLGTVPIGEPFPGLSCALLDDGLEPVEDGETGELFLGGDQLAVGYWQDAERTRESFLDLAVPGHPEVGRWYRTGDLATYAGAEGYVWIGRKDSQIKVNGHRVELGEIEHFLREAAETAQCVALDWPRTSTGAGGIAGFVAGSTVPSETILRRCREAMPPFMVPRSVRRVSELPLNASGKVDRSRLRALLERSASP